MKPCGCDAAIELLSRLGAETAARMHAPGASIADWSPEDWLAHFEEEERLMFPLLHPSVAARLRAHHMAFRRTLTLSGRIDENALRKHSDLENAVAREVLVRFGDG